MRRPARENARTVSLDRDEDGELMAAVAERGDRAAFARLIERHQAALFNLATYLNGSHEAAEETVQEALLVVWRKAVRFEYLGPGSVRAWLMRLTANEGLRLRQRHIRNVRRDERARVRPTLAEAPAPDENAERGELLAALRGKLGELTGLERDVVALYYGAGLDQKTIAEKLDLSQQAVSYKLKRILETLREGLLKGGFAVALPLLESADLGGALHGGVEVPAGFADRVAFSLTRESVRSMRVAAVGGVSYAVLAALLLLAAGGAVWWFAQNRVPRVPAVEAPPAAMPKAAPVAASAGEAGKPYRVEWDFRERPAPEDFKVLLGTWMWKPPQGGWPGGMEGATLTDKVVVRLPATPPHCPLRLRVHARTTSGNTIEFAAGWLQEGTAPMNYFKRKDNMKFQTGVPTLFEYLFVDRLVVCMRDGMVVSSRDYGAAYSGDGLGMTFVNQHVERVELEEIGTADIEQFMKDHPDPFKKGTFSLFKDLKYTYPDEKTGAPAAK